MATTDLMTALPVSEVTFMPQWRQEFSRQAGGTPRVSDIGPEVWMAKIAAGIMGNDDAESTAALINQMRGSLGTFYVWNPRRQYPRMDADGSIIGSSVVTIYALDADTRYLRLEGLPVGYVIKRGDFLSWDQGSSPVHRRLHQFMADATADGAGRIALTEVAPHIAAGASATVASVITITIASPAVVSWTAHGLVAGREVKFSTTGALPTGIVAGTTYYVIAAGLATDNFRIAATVDGAAINTSGTQSGTHTGTAPGLTISLKRPAAEMMILPGSYDFPSAGSTVSSISFTAIQIP